MRDPRDTGDCLWTTWKAWPAAKGARRLRWPATWNARGLCASTRAGAIRSLVTRCARRWVESGGVAGLCGLLRLAEILGSSPSASCIALVLYSRLSYVEHGGFSAQHT